MDTQLPTPTDGLPPARACEEKGQAAGAMASRCFRKTNISPKKLIPEKTGSRIKSGWSFGGFQTLQANADRWRILPGDTLPRVLPGNAIDPGGGKRGRRLQTLRLPGVNADAAACQNKLEDRWKTPGVAASRTADFIGWKPGKCADLCLGPISSTRYGSYIRRHDNPDRRFHPVQLKGAPP